MRIELDSATGIITINGIDLHFDALDVLTKARPEYVYQFKRDDDSVLVMKWRTADVEFPKGQEPMSYGK